MAKSSASSLPLAFSPSVAPTGRVGVPPTKQQGVLARCEFRGCLARGHVRFMTSNGNCPVCHRESLVAQPKPPVSVGAVAVSPAAGTVAVSAVTVGAEVGRQGELEFPVDAANDLGAPDYVWALALVMSVMRSHRGPVTKLATEMGLTRGEFKALEDGEGMRKEDLEAGITSSKIRLQIGRKPRRPRRPAVSFERLRVGLSRLGIEEIFFVCVSHVAKKLPEGAPMEDWPPLKEEMLDAFPEIFFK